MEQKIDRARRRRRALTGAVLILIMAGLATFEALSERMGAWRAVDYVRLSGVLMLVVVVSLRATTNFSVRARVPALDDELTRANRANAAAWGYWGLMTALGAALAAAFFTTLDLRALIPFVLVCGAACAGLRFVMLERRGE